MPRPSRLGPVSASIACSGCGISPTTRPSAEQTPAMSSMRSVRIAADVAEHDPPPRFQLGDGRGLGDEAAVTVLDRNDDASRPARNAAVQKVPVFSTRSCWSRQTKRSPRVARERARQQAGFAQHLETVADAEHRQPVGAASTTSATTGEKRAMAPARR